MVKPVEGVKCKESKENYGPLERRSSGFFVFEVLQGKHGKSPY